MGDMMKRKRGWRKKGEKRRKLKLQPNAKQKKGPKKRNALEKNLNVVMKPRNLKKRRQRRRAGEVILNQANLKRRRPKLQILKVRKTLKRNPKSIRERKKVKMKTMKARMRKLPKRNTLNAKVTDQRAKMKVLGKDRERKQKVLQ